MGREGDSSLNNGFAGGVSITRASQNTIGGNTVSGHSTGVSISGEVGSSNESPENHVIANSIGADISAARPIPNGSGVFINEASRSLITLNTIAFNQDGGVSARIGVGNFITTNSIHSNRRLGIDLRGSPGVTPNDGPGDPDKGANNLQNFPILTAVKDANGECKIKGVLESAPNTTFRIEFFASQTSPAIRPAPVRVSSLLIR